MSFYKLAIIMFLLNSFSGKVICAPTPPTTLFPHGCEVSGFGFDNNQLIVNSNGQQSFYLLQNHNNVPIELQRVEEHDDFMSPSLNAKLEPLNWAAFASDIANMHFKCFLKENETIKPLNCSDVLDICQYPRVKFALSNMGNYWVSTNKTQKDVIDDAIKKGIYLRW